MMAMRSPGPNLSSVKIRKNLCSRAALATATGTQGVAGGFPYYGKRCARCAPPKKERSAVKLYLVEIGGMRDGNLFESHEVHAMVAGSEEQLIRDCEDRFSGIMRASHLDGWIEIELDMPSDNEAKDRSSFFVAELGRNSAHSMREEHDYRFLNAKDWKEAVQTARQDAPGWHVDACVNLDELAQKAGYVLRRDQAGIVSEPRAQSRYVRFLETRRPI